MMREHTTSPTVQCLIQLLTAASRQTQAFYVQLNAANDLNSEDDARLQK